MEKFKVTSIEDLGRVSESLLKYIDKHKVVAFYGDMGVGKTTLIKEITKRLGVTDVVSSPTFSIVNEYGLPSGQKVYHFDFYRVEEEEEAYDLGYEEYFYSDNYCFVEWPQNIPNLMPKKKVEVIMEMDDKDNRWVSVLL